MLVYQRVYHLVNVCERVKYHPLGPPNVGFAKKLGLEPQF